MPPRFEAIHKEELDRKRKAWEYMRHAWPADTIAFHNTMNCFRWIWNEKGTAPFLKPKEYQKINVEAYELEEDEND